MVGWGVGNEQIYIYALAFSPRKFHGNLPNATKSIKIHCLCNLLLEDFACQTIGKNTAIITD